jgi:hypothetical protein
MMGPTSGALDGPGLGWVLSQRKVRPGSVVGVDVATNHAQQLRFGERDDMVETVPTEGSDDPFDVRVLPGRSGSDDHLRKPEALDASVEHLAVDPIAVANHVTSGRSPRQGLDHLLRGPGGRGVAGDVDVKHAPPGEAHDDETRTAAAL